MQTEVFKTLVPLMTGATLGATTRHLLTRNVTSQIALRRVCLINTAGSFALGMTHALQNATRISPSIALGVGTGFCGALTTFSTFSALVLDLAAGDSPQLMHAGCYVVASVVLGVLAVSCGRRTARLFIR